MLALLACRCASIGFVSLMEWQLRNHLFDLLGRLQRLDAALRMEQGRFRPDLFRLARLARLKQRVKARLQPSRLTFAGA